MAVMDASVYVARTNANEPGYQTCWAWFRETISSGEQISAPMIILAEVAAALSERPEITSLLVPDCQIRQTGFDNPCRAKTGSYF